MKTCSIDGCEKVSLSKTFCKAHYRRFLRNGSALAGSTSRGEAQMYLDDVVANYSDDACLLWPYAKDKNGYGRFQNKSVCRLVCEKHNGQPPSPKHESAHSCNNSSCCNKKHIRWATKSENECDKIANGTSNRGERSSMHKLSNDEVLEILRRATSGEKVKPIAAEYNINYGAVYDIKKGKTWSWLTGIQLANDNQPLALAA